MGAQRRASWDFVDLSHFADRRLEVRLNDERIARLDPSRPPSDANAVAIVSDSFLSSFDVEPVVAAARVLRAMGFVPVVAPVLGNGKVLEVRSYGQAYAKAKARLQTELKRYVETGVPVVSIEPAMTVQARVDGATFLLPIETFLAEQVALRPAAPAAGAAGRLFLHCTEKSFDPLAQGGGMATGFSCRCQAKRFGVDRLRHPIEVLAEMIVGESRG